MSESHKLSFLPKLGGLLRTNKSPVITIYVYWKHLINYHQSFCLCIRCIALRISCRIDRTDSCKAPAQSPYPHGNNPTCKRQYPYNICHFHCRCMKLHILCIWSADINRWLCSAGIPVRSSAHGPDLTHREEAKAVIDRSWCSPGMQSSEPCALRSHLKCTKYKNPGSVSSDFVHRVQTKQKTF